MEKLYYNLPYVKEFEAVVMECRPVNEAFYEVILDRTAFYPEGGGQPGDTGKLNEALVLDVYELSGEIRHMTDKPFPQGTKVYGMIHWEKRFCYMQNHSGEHILSGIVHRRYGFDNVGFHMGWGEVTVDFNGILTMEQVEEIELEANRLVYENVPVLEHYPSEEELDKLDYRSKKELKGQVRIIEIPGGDVCACCGTHVAKTGEIGLIKVTGMSYYKGGVRLSMLCGLMAFLDYSRKLKAVTGISNLLSAKTEAILPAVEKLKEESKNRECKIRQLYKELFEKKTESYPEGKERLAIFEKKLEPGQIRQFCTMLYEADKGSVCLVCSGKEGLYQYAMGSKSQDMRVLSRALNERLNGRGGGSSLMVQGTLEASEEEIRSVFKDL